MRGRSIATTYTYDEAGRVTTTIASPAWTDDDRALMLALQLFEDTLCPGCGNPRHLAWEIGDNDYWMPPELEEIRCHACSVEKGEDVTYSMAAIDTRVNTT